MRNGSEFQIFSPRYLILLPPILEVIIQILSFLQIFSVRKSTTVFLSFPNICKKNRQKSIFLAYVAPLKANYRLFLRLLTLPCFFQTIITVFFYIYNTIYPYLLLLFFHFVFLFSPSLSSRLETHFTIRNVSYNFIANSL